GGLKAFAKLAVNAPTLARVEVSPFSPFVGIGSSVRLKATAVYTDGSVADVTSTAMWSVTDSTVASVTSGGANAGAALGINGGSTVISASFGGMTGTTPITVTGAKLLSVSVQPSAATIAIGGSITLKATATYSDGTAIDITNNAVWATSDAMIASNS